MRTTTKLVLAILLGLSLPVLVHGASKKKDSLKSAIGEEILVSGAFFNVDIQGFGVVAGKSTTIEVYPTIQKRGPSGGKYFTPELVVRVIEEGVVKSEGVINERMDSSIAWSDYKGPLEF